MQGRRAEADAVLKAFAAHGLPLPIEPLAASGTHASRLRPVLVIASEGQDALHLPRHDVAGQRQ